MDKLRQDTKKAELEDKYASSCEANASAPSLKSAEYEFVETEAGLAIKKYLGNDEHTVLPSEYEGHAVVAVLGFAFCGKNMKSVKIPFGIASIGKFAFSECPRLEQVIIPEGVSFIDSGVFSYCSALKTIDIPTSITYIHEHSFMSCSSLTAINYASSIGDWSAMERIEGWDFNTGEYTVFCNDGTIDKSGSANGVYSPRMPETPPEILPPPDDEEPPDEPPIPPVQEPEESPTDEPEAPPIDTPTPEPPIPDGEPKPRGNRGGAPQPDDAKPEKSEAFKFEKLGEFVTLVKYLLDEDKVTVPESFDGLPVCAIEPRAFASKRLCDITLPDGLISIGKEAFAGCERLAVLKLPNRVKKISDSAFASCTALCSLTLSAELTAIGSKAFLGAHRLRRVVIPIGVKSIGDGAFYDCRSLHEVHLPSTVTKIGAEAFAGCTELYDIKYAGTASSFGSIELGVQWCRGASYYMLRAKDGFIAPSTEYCADTDLPKDTPASSFTYEQETQGIKITKYIGGALEVSVPSQIQGLPVYCIAEEAFLGCNITAIRLPKGLTHIEQRAFSRCKALEKIIIPPSVLSLGKGAFEYCESLMSAEIMSDNISLEPEIFFDCNSLRFVLIRGADKLSEEIFWSCDKLDTVFINRIDSIEQGAFDGCELLRRIVFNGSIDEWESVDKDLSWDDFAEGYTVYCRDGSV